MTESAALGCIRLQNVRHLYLGNRDEVIGTRPPAPKSDSASTTRAFIFNTFCFKDLRCAY